MTEEKKNLEELLRSKELEIEFPDTIEVKLSDGNFWHVSPMPLSKNRKPLIDLADKVNYIFPLGDVESSRKFVIDYFKATTYPKFRAEYFEQLLITSKQVQNIWFAAVWGANPKEVPELVRLVMKRGAINKLGGASESLGESEGDGKN